MRCRSRCTTRVRGIAIPRDALSALVDGGLQDLEQTRYATFDDLRGYCEKVAGAVGVACIAVYGSDDVERAMTLGIALQLINIMRDVAEDAELGRVYLPQDELERFGVHETLGRVDARVAELMAFQAQRARAHLDEGLRLLDSLDRRSALCVVDVRRASTAASSTAWRRTASTSSARRAVSRRRRSSPSSRADSSDERSPSSAAASRGSRRRSTHGRRRRRDAATRRGRRSAARCRRCRSARAIPSRRRTTASTSRSAASPSTCASSTASARAARTCARGSRCRCSPRTARAPTSSRACRPSRVRARAAARPGPHPDRHGALPQREGTHGRDVRRRAAPLGASDAAIDRFWDVFIRPALNLRTDEVDAGAGLFTVRTALLGPRGNADLVLPLKPLGWMHGDAAGRVLGERVQLDERVESLDDLDADAIVVAVPPHESARLLGDPEPRLEDSPIVSVHLWFDRSSYRRRSRRCSAPTRTGSSTAARSPGTRRSAAST